MNTGDISLNCILDIDKPLNALLCLNNYANGNLFAMVYIFLMIIIIGSYVYAKGPGDGLLIGGMFSTLIGTVYFVIIYIIARDFTLILENTLSLTLIMVSLVLCLVGVFMKYFQTAKD